MLLVILSIVDDCIQVQKAQEVAAKRGRFTTEDVLFLIRKVSAQS